MPASSTDFQDPTPAKKRQQRRVPPASKAPGSIGRQARGKPFGGSRVDRMEMGCALDAVLAQDSVEEQEDVGIYGMLSGQASSAYPAVKTPGSSPRTEGYGSPRDKTPRIQHRSRQTSWPGSQNPLQPHDRHRTPDCVRAASILKLSV